MEEHTGNNADGSSGIPGWAFFFYARFRSNRSIPSSG
nr:MAG TPA: hypothetical protein [Caudoviricetes sp.]